LTLTNSYTTIQNKLKQVHIDEITKQSLAMQCGFDKINYVKFANMVGLYISEDDVKQEHARANTVYKQRQPLAQSIHRGPN